MFKLLEPPVFPSYFVPHSYDDAVNIAPDVQRGMHCSGKLECGFHGTSSSV